jgi:uncharacterized protein (DUF1501 family)
MSCCDEYARAGRGLPAIEPGMPTPAGTGMSRRSLLLRGAGLALSVYGADRLGLSALREGVAQAAPPTHPVIVSVFLSGGVDGLSLLPPVGDPRYTPSLRPDLYLRPQDTLAVQGTTMLRWHSAAAPLKALHDDGRLTLLPAVGYPQANGSHFTSRHFYETGGLNPEARTGWLGRYLDVVGEVDNPIQGLTLGSQLSPSLASDRVAVAAAPTEGGYEFPGGAQFPAGVTAELDRGFDALAALRADDPVLRYARQAHANAAGLRRSLAGTLPPGSPGYDDTILDARLQALARLLRGGLGIRAATVDAQIDFDTHAGQVDNFATRIGSACNAIAAFQADLDATPALANRVITLVWSEFGRRPEQNGSLGTDHGAAGVAMVIGPRAAGGIVGGFPGLAMLDAEDNLLPTADFRSLYASLLESWLGVDGARIVPTAPAARYALTT